MSQARVSLVDPMLYNSTYINPNPPKPVKINFWKKFNFYSFLFNILLPVAVVVFILFMLKYRYWAKRRKDQQRKIEQQKELLLMMQMNQNPPNSSQRI